MKRCSLIFILLLFVGCIIAQQTEPQVIKSIAIEKHNPEWYDEQAKLWKQKTIDNPMDEDAWRNYFKATRYYEMVVGSDSFPLSKAVADEMFQAGQMPGTYAYYACRYELERNVYSGKQIDYGQLAVDNMPENVSDDEVFMLLGYLWMSGAADDSISQNHKKWLELQQRQFKKRVYPERLLRYMYNQFLGMKSNALYFANGDMALFPAKFIQDELNVQKDKQVIVMPFLHIDNYRNALFAKLGIAPFVPEREYDLSKDDEYNAYYVAMIEYIIQATGREAYFFPDINSLVIPLLSEKLYNEGLLLHYSNHKYDNIAVAKHNVEKRYHLDYLTEPNFGTQEWWSGNERMQMNYVVLLSHLVKEYKKEGNKEQALRLSYILRMSVVNTPVGETTKKAYLEILEKAEK